MDLRELFLIVRRWLWLLILGSILGGVATYFYSIYQQPIYESSAEVFVSQPGYNQLTDLGYYSIYQLIPTYAELMVTDEILQETADQLGYSIHPSQINVQQVRDTQILRVRVQSIDPNRAANFANMLVVVFREQQYALQTARYADSKQNLEANLADQQKVIEDLLERFAQIPDTEEYQIEREWTNLLVVQANDLYSNLLNNY